MIREIKEHTLFATPPTTNRGLVNVFSGIKASPEQHHDLMNFRKIGDDHLRSFIAYHIPKQPSTNAPVRKNRLLTMATRKKMSKRFINQKERK